MQMALGQYIPNNTIIHKMDPRTKIISLFILMTAVFVQISWKSSLLVSLIILFGLRIAKVSFNTVFKTIKSLFFMFIMLGTLNLFLIKTGPILFTIPWINRSVHIGSLIQTGNIFLRITLVVCMSIILTSSTDPLRLTLGLEKLLKPLKKIGVPVSIFAMMISIALRFVPTLMEEAQKIIKAQASRGLDFYNGGIKTKSKAIISLIIPLLITSFNKADELALAMEAKNYNPLIERPRYRKISFHKKDYITLSILSFYLIWLFLERFNVTNLLG